MTGFEGLPNGTRACVYLETRDDRGELVNEQYVTFFIRGFDDGRQLGELSPGHGFDEELRAPAPVLDVTQHIDEDQTFRYAPASGDPMPIHLDEEVAREAGLPGIIAHGFCVLAFTSWAILQELGESDARRLRRLAVRFAKPVLPGQDIRTRAWRERARRHHVLRIRDDGRRHAGHRTASPSSRTPRDNRDATCAHPGGAARGDAREASRRDDRVHPGGRLRANHDPPRGRTCGRLGGCAGVPLAPPSRPRGGGGGAPGRARRIDASRRRAKRAAGPGSSAFARCST